MSLNTESLRKIIELEQKKGYSDSAVIGGLDRFLSNWVGQVVGSISSRRLLERINRLGGSNYASLAKPQRKKWISDVFELLHEVESQPGTGDKPLENSIPSLASAKVRKSSVSGVSLDSPVTVIKGISTGLSAKFSKLGVKTVRDLLYFFPHRHLDYSQVKSISQLSEGPEQTIVANVWEASVAKFGGRPGTEATVGDETGNVRAVWFNQPYLAKRLLTNTRIVLSGRVSLFKGRHVFESPEWEVLEAKELVHTARLVPVYSLTQGLHPRQVRKLMKGVIEQWAWQVEDFLLPEMKKQCNLLDLSEAISQAHFPDDVAAKDRARLRLAFDELFLLQLGVTSKKRDWQESQPGNPIGIKASLLEPFLKSLPFELTGAQQRVLGELLHDIQQARPMSRLLQGDVGSGKTVVATVTLLMAAANDYQSAFMAPTEVLAEQHFATICEFLSRLSEPAEGDHVRSYAGILPRPLTVALLIGDLNQARKQRLQQRIADGEIDIIIGTHALIQKGVEFHRLALAVVDEQHRFGVTQRSILRQKGFNPHMLVMTATPIPRTLALTLYGDLDLSVIDEMPPGRQVIKTKWLTPSQRDSAFAFIRRQVASGHQAFIICPLIEESEAVAAQAAVAEYDYLSTEVFSDLKLGLLHGRMSSSDKDEVMRRFRAGELDMLVSTPVIEVGIDVPNATVMLVESADHFGLAQLHQFRGRVGRGQAQSYCLLLAENPSEVARARLDIIERVQNGFVLAEEDLKLRGPGEFFGTRQSGLPDLRMAKLSDVAILELARSEAMKVFAKDSGLKKQPLLAKELARMWPEAAEWS